MYHEITEKFISILKFVLENADREEFQAYNLVQNFSQLLIDLRKGLEEVYGQPFIYKLQDYETILRFTFRNKDEREHYEKLINTNEKKDLIRNFHFILFINDIISELDFDDEETMIYDIEPYLEQFKPFKKYINHIK